MADVVLHIVVGNHIKARTRDSFYKSPRAVDEPTDDFVLRGDSTASAEVFHHTAVAI